MRQLALASLTRNELAMHAHPTVLAALSIAALASGCTREAPPTPAAEAHDDGGAADARSADVGAKSEGDAAAATRGEALFTARCALCHKGGGQGPYLGGVVGREAASARGFGYTRALRALHVTWDRKTLDGYLAAPDKVAPGTSMPVSTPDAHERADIIAYLASQPTPDGVHEPKPMGSAAPPPAAAGPRAGKAGLGGYKDDGPGVRRRITFEDLPKPMETPSSRNPPLVVDKPGFAELHVPAGFNVAPFADGLSGPRLVRVAPNGDIVVVESTDGRIRILRAADGAAHPADNQVFATGLDRPFGVAFYPQGDAPQWLYVANNDSVVRFAYHAGDLHAAGAPEIIVPKLAGSGGGHWTRDIAFSPDGASMYVSVGSASNVGDTMTTKPVADAAKWEKEHGLGATWGDEEDRADVLVFDAQGGHRRVFASGIRNCVGLAVEPVTRALFCSTNERDGLGDDLVPDYITRVKPGGFYGWPWYFLGAHEDPRRKGERPDLATKITTPDVLLQPHSASLQMMFYTGQAFPKEMRGDAFAALHGSWNRAIRTGYKVVRVRMKGGVPTGEYEDFLTGFVVDDDHVWGRPVGVAVAHDGSLLVTEDGNGTMWRVTYGGK